MIELPNGRTCEHREGEIRLIGLPHVLLAKCKACGTCLKITMKAAKRHQAVYCPCGEQARLSREFLNEWTRVCLASSMSA